MYIHMPHLSDVLPKVMYVYHTCSIITYVCIPHMCEHTVTYVYTYICDVCVYIHMWCMCIHTYVMYVYTYICDVCVYIHMTHISDVHPYATFTWYTSKSHTCVVYIHFCWASWYTYMHIQNIYLCVYIYIYIHNYTYMYVYLYT